MRLVANDCRSRYVNSYKSRIGRRHISITLGSSLSIRAPQTDGDRRRERDADSLRNAAEIPAPHSQRCTFGAFLRLARAENSQSLNFATPSTWL
jgi:hypothetical protein